MIREDEELGPVRWCKRCAEWWPDDPAFWRYSQYREGDVVLAVGRPYVRKTSGTAATCRACHADANAAGHIERRRRAGVTHHRCRAGNGCIVQVPVGRDRCYGCTGLTVPMTMERLAALTA